MTRFNITLEQGVKFVSISLNRMIGGEIFVQKLHSYNILDMAHAISKNCKIKFTGIRPDKNSEEMIAETEARNCVEYKDFYIIKPHSEYSIWNLSKFNKKNI